MSKSRLSHRPVAHKSTGGILPTIPAPVDPVGNAPHCLTPNTVAHPASAFALADPSQLRASLTSLVRESA